MSLRPCSTAAVHLQLHGAEQWCSMGRTGCCLMPIKGVTVGVVGGWGGVSDGDGGEVSRL